jgi:Arc/MetJ-type ribon-helix-helix transcriptional regulator
MVLEVLEMPRARVFATIREDLLIWVDEQVKRGIFRNRSHALEYGLIRLKEEDEKRRQEA